MAERINQLNQEFAPGKMVDLFTIDLTPVGGEILRFTPTTDGVGGAVLFNGAIFVPSVSEMEDVAYSGSGQLPRATIKIQNISGAIIAESLANHDLLGMVLTRVRTYEIFLDGGSEPDSTQVFPPEIWILNRITEQNNIYCEWELTNPMDQQGRLLPGRQIIKEGCPHVYRKLDPDSNVLQPELVTCPYNRAPSFDRQGNSLPLGMDAFGNDKANPLDRCGKKLRDCRLRFDLVTDTLPLLSFPGVGGIR